MVYEACDGQEGVDEARHRRPDLIVMDLEMPQLDGYSAIDLIMRSEAACPIVVLSASVDGPSSYAAARCFEVGAVEVLRKPTSLTVSQFRSRLLSTLRTMAKARVVRRKSGETVDMGRISETTEQPRWERPSQAVGHEHPQIIAIGSSTGGPPVLFELVKQMPKPLPCPVVIAQHILPGFDVGLARWLSNSGHPVSVVDRPMPIVAGQVYLAPGDRHMVVKAGVLSTQTPRDGEMVPAADVLMESVAREYGRSAVGVVLTGMGRDGADGLLAMKNAGAETYTQSAETCAVNGMPQAARDLGASMFSLSPPDLAAALARRLAASSVP